MLVSGKHQRPKPNDTNGLVKVLSHTAFLESCFKFMGKLCIQESYCKNVYMGG